MPKPRGKRTRLTVDRETFEAYFLIDSGGPSIAIDAMAAGTIRTPYEVVETVCLTNELMGHWFFEDVVEELELHGKAGDYIAARDLRDSDRSEHLILQYVGLERVREMLLGIQNEVREELLAGNISALPLEGEPAVVPTAPWRFEQYFQLDGPGHWIAVDALRQSVIGTPYEVVKMICDVNEMYTMRLRENALGTVFEHYTPEELLVAIRNGTIVEFLFRQAGSEGFEQRTEKLMLEVRRAFGVNETAERGTAEKFKLWLETRRKPVH